MCRELFGPDAEDEVTGVEVPGGSLDPLIWPKELYGSDPLICEATEQQLPPPETYGGEMVLDDPPPSRSNHVDGVPNQTNPDIHGGEIVLDDPTLARSNHEDGVPKQPHPDIHGGEIVLHDPTNSTSNTEIERTSSATGQEGVMAGPNTEFVVPNDEAAGPTKHYGCTKCRYRYGGCSQCKRWADANRHSYARDNLGNPY